MRDPDRRLSERLHGIADHSMSMIIGNMVQEMITELKMRESPGYPGHISFSLTDAEREAVNVAQNLLAGTAHGKSLGRLLERLGGER